MSEEFDVFAQAAKPAQGAKSEADAQQAPRQKPDAKPAAKRAPYRKGAMPRARQRAAKPNNSPLRGPSADGSECVNPLLNAPLPKEKPAEVQEQAANPNRDPSLPEYRLADLQTWPAQEIVDKIARGTAF